MKPMYSSNQPTENFQLKASIRDMIQLQQNYQLSDESFWEIFNRRVLLNEHIEIGNFITNMRGTAGHA